MSVLNKSQLQAENQSSFPNNNAGLITPEILRNFNTDMIDSLVDSLQTASLATTGSNIFTGNQTIDANLYISGNNFIDFNGSGFRIQDATNGVSLLDANNGLQLRNFVTNDIQIEQNANGAISIDNNSGSVFINAHRNAQNVYISGSDVFINNVSFIPFSSSVNARILAITGSGGNVDTSSLVTTASFNTFTSSYYVTSASFDTRINNIVVGTGFATTGSNTFNGDQTVNGNISINGNNKLNFGGGLQIYNYPGDIAQLAANSTIQFITEPPAGPGGINDIKFINRVTGSAITFENNQGGAGNSINFIGGNAQFTLNQVSGSNGQLQISAQGGVVLNADLSASLQEGYVWVGDYQNISKPFPTSSFAGGGSVNTGSLVTTASFNQFTASTNTSLTNLNTTTASLNTSVNNLNSTTASINTSLTNLNSATSSLFTSASLALVTASISGTTLTFAKGNGTTFNLTLPTGSGGTGSLSTVGLITTGSATSSIQAISGGFQFNTFYTGNWPVTSYDGGASTVYIDYGVRFDGAPTSLAFNYWSATGWAGVTVNGPGVTNATITGDGYGSYYEVYLSSGTVTNGATYTFTGPTQQTLGITGSISATEQIRVDYQGNKTVLDANGVSNNAANQMAGGVFAGQISIADYAVSPNDQFGMAISSSVYSLPQWNTGPFIYGYDSSNGNTALIGFQNSQTYTDGRVTVLTPLEIQSGSAFYANGHKQFNMGQFQTNVSQSGSANVSQSINFEVTDLSYGVSIVSNNRITLANAGVYNINFSAQCDNTDNAAQTIYIWLKKNGTNVPESATKLVIPKDQAQVMTVLFNVEAAAGDYYQLEWQSTNIGCFLKAENASGNIPAIPSVILGVNQLR